MAATLSRANQNSNSPKFFTLVRFTAVSTTMNTKAISHTGRAGKMVASRPAAPRASAAITTTSCSHHSQPTVAPATGP
jgi:BRCT domain type II-containing protein